MKKMKVWSTVLATGVALTTLAACSGGSNSTTASSSEEKADKKSRIGNLFELSLKWSW